MPIDAMYGFAAADALSRPNTVVSTAMAFRASPLGFSANSTMRPFSSIFISPKSLARESSIGRHPIVTSAFVLRWWSTNFM